MALTCNRTLDKPVLILGLEIEDVAIISGVIGLGSLIVNPLFPLAVGIIGWCVCWHYKKDKPSGYLLHVMYTCGLPLPGLLPPQQHNKQYSIR